MANRTIKEGEPIDPIQVGDIITLELKDGTTISGLLAAEHWSGDCEDCDMFGTGVRCYTDWVVKNPGKHEEGFDSMSLCCTKPVSGLEVGVRPEFCRFIKLDTVMENL